MTTATLHANVQRTRFVQHVLGGGGHGVFLRMGLRVGASGRRALADGRAQFLGELGLLVLALLGEVEQVTLGTRPAGGFE